MKFQLKPAPVAPVPATQIIVVGGREIGTLKPSTHSGNRLMAVIKVPNTSTSILGSGFGDGPAQAVEAAFQDLNTQVEAIQQFLAEVSA